MLPAYLQDASVQYRLDKARRRMSLEQIPHHLRILDDHKQLIPYKPKRAQAHFLANRTGRDLLLKARQIGFSTCIQADMFVAAITSAIGGATLAHDDATTQKLRRMAQLFYNELPAHLKPRRGLDNATTTTYPDTYSEIMIATAGNTSAGRGGTLNYLHGSEVAYWKDADELLAGIMQSIPLGYGQVVLESTANGAQGFFYDVCMAALRGEGIWKLHFYAWWWDERYQLPLEPGERLVYTDEEQALVQRHGLTPEQIKWRRAKQGEFLTNPTKFFQEYPEDPEKCFLTSGGTVFGNFDHAIYLPEQHEPVDGHRHVAGIDWGQSGDYSTLCIMDSTANREVLIERWQHMRYGDIRAEMIRRLQEWRVEYVVAEKNSASSNVEALQDEMDDAGLDASLEAYSMSNKGKSSLVNTFYEGLHTSGLKLLENKAANHELRIFRSSQTSTGLYTYEAPSGQHDDTVIARLLAYYASLQRIDL